MNIKDVKVLIYDYGCFSFLAEKLAKEYKEVMYFAPWEGSQPKRAMIGEGLVGVNNIDDFWEAKKKLDKKHDLICFFDVGEGGLQEDLRSQGYNVFGMGDAENLEDSRVFFKQELKNLGLPVIPFKHIVGVEALDEYLKTVKNKFVKIDKYRWLMESFPHINYAQSQPRIRSLLYYSGSFHSKIEFIVEDTIDAIELGTDNFITDTGYYDTCLFGYEAKGKSYSARVMETEKLPKLLKRILAKSIPYYKRTRPRGMFSTEIRVTEDNTPYWIDATMRGGLPPTESLMTVYKNFNEALYAVATGRKIKLEPIAPYVSQIELSSLWAMNDPMVIEFPDKIKDFVLLQNVCKLDGYYKYIPQEDWSIVGAAVGIGKTLQESRDMAEKVAKQIVADSLEYNPEWEAIDKEIEKAKKQGLGDFNA